MNTKGIDVKERIRAVIVDWYKLKMPDQRLIELRAILADLEAAEPPRPAGEPAAFKRPCYTCGHQGNIMDKYCGSCGIEHLNWIPKSAECKNRVQVCPECNIDMYQDISTKNAGLWVWYCPECGQEIKIT